MSVNVLQWRAGARIFYHGSHRVINTVSQTNYIPKVKSIISYFYCILCSLLLFTHDDTETKSDPKKFQTCFLCCHRNINSLTAHA